ncbi:hypothetical protein RB195_013565 [Necator americanus]|uniref:Uncharacterized protein n=1 Tax=Necator americanus TaxID=51031 RepID=A0ABR1DW56_NECAM
MPRSRKRALCSVISLLLISIFYLSSLKNKQKSKFWNKCLEKPMRSRNIVFGIDEEISETTHLFENACRYVWVEDVEPSMKSQIRLLPPVVCEPLKNEPFVRDMDGSFSWRDSVTINNCTASRVFGGMRSTRREVIEHEASREKIEYDNFYVNADVFFLTCYEISGIITFKKIYTGIYDNANSALVIQGRPIKPVSSVFDRKNMSISIFGLDSTARAQLHRHMPKTVLQMQKMGFLTFHGYNKVGDNSAVNLIPILAEQVKEGLRFPYFDKENDVNTARFLPSGVGIDPDTIPFLWKKMKEKGCVTMFNDDIMNTFRGLFHYPKKNFLPGFTVPPTQHYYRAYYVQIYLNSARNSPLHLLRQDPRTNSVCVPRVL